LCGKIPEDRILKLSEKAGTMIDGKNFGHLAFVTPKGDPHVTPVWLDRDGDIILINAAEFRVKIKFLKVNQKVMLSITEQENPYNRALIRGHVIEITKNGALDQNNRMSMKYLGTLDDPDRPVGDRVLIKIEADQITS
jgi:Pyridoxamine 5'-phosphate oxidase